MRIFIDVLDIACQMCIVDQPACMFSIASVILHSVSQLFLSFVLSCSLSPVPFAVPAGRASWRANTLITIMWSTTRWRATAAALHGRRPKSPRLSLPSFRNTASIRPSLLGSIWMRWRHILGAFVLMKPFLWVNQLPVCHIESSMSVSLLQYGNKKSGGVEHVPPGWDHWFALVRKRQQIYQCCII